MTTSLIPTGTRERRIVKLQRIELRAAADGKGLGILEGHAAVFNTDSPPMYGFTESVNPGTFSRAIKENDIRGLFNHNPDYVLGRNTADTMRLSEDADGLAFEIDLPDTSCARDLVVSIGRRDITGCSFSFSTVKDEWEYKDDGSVHRTLIDVNLYDVGPVTFPAYPDTDVSLRSMEAILAEGKRRIDERRSAGIPLELRRRQIDLLSL